MPFPSHRRRAAGIGLIASLVGLLALEIVYRGSGRRTSSPLPQHSGAAIVAPAPTVPAPVQEGLAVHFRTNSASVAVEDVAVVRALTTVRVSLNVVNRAHGTIRGRVWGRLVAEDASGNRLGLLSQESEGRAAGQQGLVYVAQRFSAKTLNFDLPAGGKPMYLEILVQDQTGASAPEGPLQSLGRITPRAAGHL